MQFQNTTNRSWWFVHTQPIKSECGYHKNPTDRSRWIVHTQPFRLSSQLGLDTEPSIRLCMNESTNCGWWYLAAGEAAVFL